MLNRTVPPSLPARNGESILVRTAVGVGRVLGNWRTRRTTAAQEAYVEAWKAAWTQGCDARLRDADASGGGSLNGFQRDAWLAGWNWADSHPERRDARREELRREQRQRLTKTAKRGATGVALLAIAQWVWRSRVGRSRVQKTDAPAD